MYRKQAIVIPNAPGKIVRLKNGSTIYIYYQIGDRTYDKGKKYTTAKRVLIGKVCPGSETEMYPNDSFFQLFPDIPYLESEDGTERSYSIKIGNYILISKIIQELDLSRILSFQFDEDDRNLLLDLAAYGIITENNAGQYYPMYAYEHAIFTSNMRIYSDCKVSRWMSSVTSTDIVRTMEKWNESRNHKDPVYVTYDSTNKNSQAGDVEFVEYGAPKVDVGLPIINYALVYDVKERLPLFYESYPGSIPDVAQLHYMVEKAEKYQYKNIGFILDRGYFSEANIQELDRKKYPFVIMIKGRKKVIRSIIEENLHTFENKSRNYIEEYDVFGCTVEKKLFESDKEDRYIHLYHQASKAAAELAHFNNDLRKMRKEMAKCIGESIILPKSYSDYFTLYYNKVEKKIKGEDEKTKTIVETKFVAFEEKENVVEQERNLCGYFALATSKKMNAREALVLYKSRDGSEKVFRGDKSYLGDKSMRVYSTESTETKIFVEFFALAIRSRIYAKLHDYNLSLPTKMNYLTVPAAIRELEKIIMIRLPDKEYHMSHSLTKTQKTILAAFGLTGDDITEGARKIAESLKKIEDCEEKNNGKT